MGFFLSASAFFDYEGQQNASSSGCPGWYRYDLKYAPLGTKLMESALGQTTRYCDPASSICFSGWNGGNGLSIGVALPKVAAAPFDTVLQIISPIANGWVGFSWGGTMPYVPLTIGWPNNASNTAIYSSRMAL